MWKLAFLQFSVSNICVIKKEREDTCMLFLKEHYVANRFGIIVQQRLVSCF